MGMSVRSLEDVIGHYMHLLSECEEAQEVIRSWGLVVEDERYEAGCVHDELIILLAGGVEEI